MNMTSEEKIAKVNEMAAKDVKAITEKISKFMLLPNEIPSLFEVDDANTLKASQPFFANAENGDKLLVYPIAAKAIIWSPSKNMIVNMGPVTPSDLPK